MPGDCCVVCGNYRINNPGLSFHRIPTEPAKRSVWVQVLELDPETLKPHHRVCSRHFLNGDPKNGPQPHIGKRFSSPIKKGSDRNTRAIGRQQSRRIQELQSVSSSTTPSSSTSNLPQLPVVHESPTESTANGSTSWRAAGR